MSAVSDSSLVLQMRILRALRFSLVLLGAFALQGCTHVQSIAAFEFTVRVLDVADDKPVVGAEVFPSLSSGVANRPSIELGPLKTDAHGIVRVKFSGQSVKVSSFDSYFVGGYNSWPWIYVTHPDYQRSGYSPPDDTERNATTQGEVLIKMQRKPALNQSPEPGAASGRSL
jgi:hypothetical protein